MPYKFSAFDGFGKERARAGDAVPVDYTKFVATVKKGVEGVIFESGGSTAIALTGEGNTMLRAEVKARARCWPHGVVPRRTHLHVGHQNAPPFAGQLEEGRAKEHHDAPRHSQQLRRVGHLLTARLVVDHKKTTIVSSTSSVC